MLTSDNRVRMMSTNWAPFDYISGPAVHSDNLEEEKERCRQGNLLLKILIIFQSMSNVSNLWANRPEQAD